MTIQQQLIEELKGVDPSTVQLKGIVDNGTPFEKSLTYFNGETNEERIDDLFSTMDLNPPESMIITFNKKSIELLTGNNDELLFNLEDVKGRLEDCIETLKSGKELDSTQDSFLRMYNIIE